MNPFAPTAEQNERLAADRERLAAIVERQRATASASEAAPAPSAPVEGVPTPRIESQESECETCHQPFTASVGVFGNFRIVARNCQACVADYERRNNPDAATIQQCREKAWEALCPPQYRDTDEAKLRFAAGSATVDRVLTWDSGRGLGLIGETGKGKTRLMFRLMERLHMAGAKIRYINAVNFADELANAYGKGSDDAERWMRALERAPLLFIDDLGKEKCTERVETFYYRVTEYRTAQKLPIFYTSNLTLKLIQQHWDDAANRGGFWVDRASAITRRIKNFCSILPV